LLSPVTVFALTAVSEAEGVSGI